MLQFINMVNDFGLRIAFTTLNASISSIVVSTLDFSLLLSFSLLSFGSSLSEADETDDMVFQDVEALKAHIFNLSDNHMEQVVMLVRGWMKNDETAKA